MAAGLDSLHNDVKGAEEGEVQGPMDATRMSAATQAQRLFTSKDADFLEFKDANLFGGHLPLRFHPRTLATIRQSAHGEDVDSRDL